MQLPGKTPSSIPAVLPVQSCLSQELLAYSSDSVEQAPVHCKGECAIWSLTKRKGQEACNGEYCTNILRVADNIEGEALLPGNLRSRSSLLTEIAPQQSLRAATTLTPMEEHCTIFSRHQAGGLCPPSSLACSHNRRPSHPELYTLQCSTPACKISLIIHQLMHPHWHVSRQVTDQLLLQV